MVTDRRAQLSSSSSLVSGLHISLLDFLVCSSCFGASQVALVVKILPASAGDIRHVGSVPGLGRSPGGGHDNPL